MNYTTIYKGDLSDVQWKQVIKDLELPEDTEEISLTAITHITTREVKERNLPPVAPK